MFIECVDKKERDILLMKGFTLIQTRTIGENTVWIFENNPLLNYDSYSLINSRVTDILTFD